MSHYYGYSDETILALTEGVPASQTPAAHVAVWRKAEIDPKYAAMNLSPYLPGLARILQ